MDVSYAEEEEEEGGIKEEDDATANYNNNNNCVSTMTSSSSPPALLSTSAATLYICHACGEKFFSLEDIEEHKVNNHPNVYCTHAEIDDAKNVPTELLHQYYGGGKRISPVGALLQRPHAPGAVPVSSGGTAPMELHCTKCQSAFQTTVGLHEHILVCGGHVEQEVGSSSSSHVSKANGLHHHHHHPHASSRRRGRSRAVNRGMKRRLDSSNEDDVGRQQQQQPPVRMTRLSKMRRDPTAALGAGWATLMDLVPPPASPAPPTPPPPPLQSQSPTLRVPTPPPTPSAVIHHTTTTRRTANSCLGWPGAETEVVDARLICDGCNRKFRHSAALERHQKFCMAEVLSKTAAASATSALSTTTITSNKELRRQHCCPYCSRSFTYIASLKKHMTGICQWNYIVATTESKKNSTSGSSAPSAKKVGNAASASTTTTTTQAKFLTLKSKSNKKTKRKMHRMKLSQRQKNKRKAIATSGVKKAAVKEEEVNDKDDISMEEEKEISDSVKVVEEVKPEEETVTEDKAEDGVDGDQHEASSKPEVESPTEGAENETSKIDDVAENEVVGPTAATEEVECRAKVLDLEADKVDKPKSPEVKEDIVAAAAAEPPPQPPPPPSVQADSKAQSSTTEEKTKLEATTAAVAASGPEVAALKTESTATSTDSNNTMMMRREQQHMCPKCKRTFTYLANFKKHLNELCPLRTMKSNPSMSETSGSGGSSEHSDTNRNSTSSDKAKTDDVDGNGGTEKAQDSGLQQADVSKGDNNGGGQTGSGANARSQSCTICHKTFPTYLAMLKHRLSHKLKTSSMSSGATPVVAAADSPVKEEPEVAVEAAPEEDNGKAEKAVEEVVEKLVAGEGGSEKAQNKEPEVTSGSGDRTTGSGVSEEEESKEVEMPQTPPLSSTVAANVDEDLQAPAQKPEVPPTSGGSWLLRGKRTAKVALTRLRKIDLVKLASGRKGSISSEAELKKKPQVTDMEDEKPATETEELVLESSSEEKMDVTPESEKELLESNDDDEMEVEVSHVREAEPEVQSKPEEPIPDMGVSGSIQISVYRKTILRKVKETISVPPAAAAAGLPAAADGQQPEVAEKETLLKDENEGDSEKPEVDKETDEKVDGEKEKEKPEAEVHHQPKVLTSSKEDAEEKAEEDTVEEAVRRLHDGGESNIPITDLASNS